MKNFQGQFHVSFPAPITILGKNRTMSHNCMKTVKFVREVLTRMYKKKATTSPVRKTRAFLNTQLNHIARLARLQTALASTAINGEHSLHRFTVTTPQLLEARVVLSTLVATTASQFQTDVTNATSGTVIEIANGINLATQTILTAPNVTIEGEPGQTTPALTFASNVQTGIVMNGGSDTMEGIIVSGGVNLSGQPYTQFGVVLGKAGVSNATYTLSNVTVQDVGVGVTENGTATIVTASADNFNNDSAGVQSGAGGSTFNDTNSSYTYDGVGLETQGYLTATSDTFAHTTQTAVADAGAITVSISHSTFTYDSNSTGFYGSCVDTITTQASTGNISLVGNTFNNITGQTALFVNMNGGGTQLLVQNNVYEYNSAGFIWTSYQGSGNQGDVTFTNNVVNVNNLASTSEPLDYFNGGSLIVLTGNCLYDNVTPSPIIVAQGNVIPATFELVETSVAYNTVGTSTTPDYTPGAVYLAPSAGSTDVLTASTILGNVVYGNGGGVGIYQTSNTVFTQIGYSTIVGNLDLPAAGYGGYGGGIYLNSPTNVGIHLLSSVVATNAASSGYSGMYSTSPSYDTTVYSDGYNWVDFSNGVTGYLSTDLSNGVADGLATASVDHQSPWTSQPLVLLVEPGSPLIGHGDPYAVTYQVRDGANQIYTVATTGAIDETVGTPGTAAVKSSTLSASQVNGTTSSPAAVTSSKSTAATVTPVTVNLSASTNLVTQSMVTYGKSPFASLAS